MRTRILIEAGITALGCLTLLGGCSVTPPPSPVERDYGLSHRLAIYGQIANPAAEENLGLVEGMDGKVALGAVNAYRAGHGYTKDMDANTFDVRPVQPGVSEVVFKDLSGGNTRGVAPNLTLGK
jgi:hypothetical protein